MAVAHVGLDAILAVNPDRRLFENRIRLAVDHECALFRHRPFVLDGHALRPRAGLDRVKNHT